VLDPPLVSTAATKLQLSADKAPKICRKLHQECHRRKYQADKAQAPEQQHHTRNNTQPTAHKAFGYAWFLCSNLILATYLCIIAAASFGVCRVQISPAADGTKGAVAAVWLTGPAVAAHVGLELVQCQHTTLVTAADLGARC
jgi:hypothetical protein